MQPPKEETNSPVQAAWWSSPGVVYFFASGSPPKAIKIGVAALTNGSSLEKAIKRRFKQVQTSNHETVQLLGIVLFEEGKYPTRDAEVLERELHMKFADYQRFKPHTSGSEWFTPNEELFDYIELNCMSIEELGLPRVISSPINRCECD
jgi:T5orf172 domain-containing protein